MTCSLAYCFFPFGFSHTNIDRRLAINGTNVTGVAEESDGKVFDLMGGDDGIHSHKAEQMSFLLPFGVNTLFMSRCNKTTK
jgi:hypothetical protein